LALIEFELKKKQFDRKLEQKLLDCDMKGGAGVEIEIEKGSLDCEWAVGFDVEWEVFGVGQTE
jgi:hypothetical protein